jgi:hypothetical protein
VAARRLRVLEDARDNEGREATELKRVRCPPPRAMRALRCVAVSHVCRPQEAARSNLERMGFERQIEDLQR